MGSAMTREQILPLIFEKSSDALLLMTEDGVAIDCNQATVTLLKCGSKSDIIGHHASKFWPEYQPDGSRSEDSAGTLLKWVQSEGTICFEWMHQCADASLLPVEVLLTAVEFGGRHIVHVNWRDITRRCEAEETLAYRRALENLLTHMSSYFINLPTEMVDSGIHKALGDLGTFVEADRSYIFVYQDGRMHNPYEWCAEGIAPQTERMQDIPFEAMAWSNEQLLRGMILNTPRVADLPPEAQAEREEFAEQGTVSVLAVPMERRGQVVGFMGFDTVRQQRHWPGEVVDLLRIAAGIVANVLDRRDAERELRVANATLEQRVTERTLQLDYRRHIAEGLRDGLAVLNSDRSLQDILDFIVQQAVKLLETGGGALYLLDDKKKMLRAGASHGLASTYTALAIPVGGAITGRAVALGEPVSVPDLRASTELLETYLTQPDMPPGWVAALEQLKADYNAVLAVPVRTHSETYGSVTLYYAESQHFTDDLIALAVAFAGQAALVIENARLRERERETATIEERNRLARDLHDAVTQTLFSASMIADTLPDLWEVDQMDAQQQLYRLGQLTRGALAEMRSLLIELRPARLVQADIQTLLQQLIDAAQGRSTVTFDLKVDGHCDLPDDVKIVMYRVVQEAFNNIIKHARAEHAFVSLRCDGRQSVLQILDDGCGFYPDEVKAGHFGVQIMAERAASIRATFVIDTNPGEGTEIKLLWRNDE
jgi:PAS domain S-box-containing protein